MVVLVTNVRILVETCTLNRISALMIFLSFFFWLGFTAYFAGFLTGAVLSTDLYGVIPRLFGNPTTYILVLLTLAAANLPDMQLKALEEMFRPTGLQDVQKQMLNLEGQESAEES